LKAPERDLTLIVLANSIALSDPFWLIMGDVKRSPFALAFMKRFVLQQSGPAPNWDLEPDALAGELTRLEAHGARYSYANEVIARAFAWHWLGERTRSAALLKLAFARDQRLSAAADPAMLAVCARSGDPALRRVGEKIGQALLEEQPDQPRTLFDLGVLYQQARQNEQAIPLFERIAGNPNLSARWLLAYSGFYLGEFFASKDPEKARGYLRLVIESGPATGSLQQKARNLLTELEKR